MEDLKDKILEVMRELGDKHFSQRIKRTPELLEYVNQFPGETIAEKVYNIFNPNEKVCSRGNNKTFISINKGYVFCGKASSCQCSKESVSNKVSISKQNMTEEEIAASNAKRVETSLKKYGVTNNGQTTNALQKHAEFYADEEKVAEATRKGKLTTKERYGDENYRNSEKLSEANLPKKTPEYWVEKTGNESYYILHDKDKLAELYEKMNAYDLADYLKVSAATVFRWTLEHGLRTFYRSEQERIVTDYIKEFLPDSVEVLTNSRKVLETGKELDIYIPSMNLAIEYNGAFYHHENIPHIYRNYHSDKFYGCLRQGIRLMTIQSTDWLNKNDIMKRMVKSFVGANAAEYTVNDCFIRTVFDDEARDFLDHHHVHGYAKGDDYVGIYHNDGLVGIMAFKKFSDYTKLVRYCSIIDIEGAFLEALNYYLDSFKPRRIIAVSDNYYGDDLTELGFTIVKELPIDYRYLDNRADYTIHKRKLYTKRSFIVDGKVLKVRVYPDIINDKIWNCGKRVWELAK